MSADPFNMNTEIIKQELGALTNQAVVDMTIDLLVSMQWPTDVSIASKSNEIIQLRWDSSNASVIVDISSKWPVNCNYYNHYTAYDNTFLAHDADDLRRKLVDTLGTYD